MLRDWERQFPGRLDSIFRALANVVPTHLMDRSLHDFAAVRPTHRAEPDGDLAFDVEMPAMPPGAAFDDTNALRALAALQPR
jgi:tRNA 2-thiocytidine biosynthesis protein TtcA